MKRSQGWCSLAVVGSLLCGAPPSHLLAEEVAVCEEATCADGDAACESASENAEGQPEANATGANATHKQSKIIDINGHGLPETSVLCFCLLGDDKLLAGCQGSTNEIRVFDRSGEYVTSIELPVKPEAINVAPDGSLLAAGEGKLLRLTADGEILMETDSPHAAALLENKDQLREQVVQQHKQQAASLPQMLAAYDQAIESLNKQLEEMEDEEQKASMEEMLVLYEDAKAQLSEQFGDQAEPEELTEEKIAELVNSALQYKMAVASISASEEAVFIATLASVGYGFDVWRTDGEFADAAKIVSDLSGCCGQMDVQANDKGVFVAENSKKRVCRFDGDGKLICEWGKSSEDVDGFGSCCNPMNLAFGPDGVVYTAEDTTGRIKRYSPEGELLSVVGAAEVVPGCKKVSIGVDSVGDQVYMLDITRNHVVVLSRVLPDPTAPLASVEESSSVASQWLRLFGFGR
ncbi:MAG: hypothetical protein AAF961_06205 [Planctomycetota bacterium]